MSTDTPLLDVYSVRVMVGWIASLGLLLLVVHLPFTGPQSRVGWGITASPERIALSEVESQDSEEDLSPQNEKAPPPTHSPLPTSTEQEVDTDKETEETNSEELIASSNVRPMHALKVNDRTPEIVGGMGALYLQINYPQEARDKGIQGRLLVEFTVTTEGRAKAIEVAESLHPLCDSAAVKGIRSVEFVPAKHNGTEVPVRMRLPIRFQLLSSDTTGVETATAEPSPPSQ